MAPKRRRSLLEDDELYTLGRVEPSGGDVCERCLCSRAKHTDDGCTCGKCDGFADDGSGDFDEED